MAVAERSEALAAAPPVEPANDQPCDHLVQFFRGNAAEDGPPDGGVRPERAAEEHVVGLVAPTLRVADGRPLEAEVADPVLAAGVRAAVEVQAQAGGVVPEPRLQMLDQAAQPASSSR